MSLYRFYRDGLEFTVTKDAEPCCHGKAVPSLGTYCFAFTDAEGNECSMVARGLFFWRGLKLYVNGRFTESYALYESKTTRVRLDGRMFISVGGEYVHHIDLLRETGEAGICLYAWQGTPPSCERQVVCLVVLRFISGLQRVYSSAMPAV